jgi:hypothetical protein
MQAFDDALITKPVWQAEQPEKVQSPHEVSKEEHVMQEEFTLSRVYP